MATVTPCSSMNRKNSTTCSKSLCEAYPSELEITSLSRFPLGQHNRGNHLLLDQVVVRGNVGRNDRLPLRQLLIDRFAEHVEYFIGLLRRGRIGASHHATQRDQVIVQSNRKIEHVLSALGPGLDELFLYLSHFLV